MREGGKEGEREKEKDSEGRGREGEDRPSGRGDGVICRFKISCRGYVKKSVATMCHNGHKTEARSSPRLLNWHKRLTDPNPEQDEQSTQPLQAPSTELRICAPPWRTIRTNTHSLRKKFGNSPTSVFWDECDRMWAKAE